jgi:hypothetical protein
MVHGRYHGIIHVPLGLFVLFELTCYNVECLLIVLKPYSFMLRYVVAILMFAGARYFIQFGRDSTRETWAGPNSRSIRDLLDMRCGCDHFILSFCDECFILFFLSVVNECWNCHLGFSAYGVGPKCWGGAAEIFSNLNLIRGFSKRELLPCADFLELGLGSEYGRHESTGGHGLALAPSRIVFPNSAAPVDIQ